MKKRREKKNWETKYVFFGEKAACQELCESKTKEDNDDVDLGSKESMAFENNFILFFFSWMKMRRVRITENRPKKLLNKNRSTEFDRGLNILSDFQSDYSDDFDLRDWWNAQFCFSFTLAIAHVNFPFTLFPMDDEANETKIGKFIASTSSDALEWRGISRDETCNTSAMNETNQFQPDASLLRLSWNRENSAEKTKLCTVDSDSKVLKKFFDSSCFCLWTRRRKRGKIRSHWNTQTFAYQWEILQWIQSQIFQMDLFD